MRRPRQSRRLNHPTRPAVRQIPVRPEQPASLIVRPGTGTSLLAGSLLLILAPSVHALTLGNINVRSALGQPLNATVPVRLGAGEALASACVAPVQQRSDLRRVPGARITTPEATREGQYELSISSASALYEPMYELELRVKCPGSAVLVRQYVLMLDLPGVIASNAAATPDLADLQSTGSAATSLPDARPTSLAVQPRGARPRATAARTGTPITSGSVYRVSDGDTLSGIAARVRDRTVSLRVLADAIHAANPAAFIRNDANLIKLGSAILIPGAADASTLAAAPLSLPITTPAAPPAPVAMTPDLLTTTPEMPAGTAMPVVPPEVPLPAAELAHAQAPAVAIQEIPAPVARRRATPESPAAGAGDTVMAGADDTNPAVAAGAGILFGLCVSALLWLRKRRAPEPVARKVAETDSPVRSEPAPIATIVEPLVKDAVEPGFSVSYSEQYDDALNAVFSDNPEPTAIARAVKVPQAAAPVQGEEIASELEKLFDGIDTTIRKRLDAKAPMAHGRTGDEAQDEPETYEVESGSAVDFFVGELDEEQDDGPAARTTDRARPAMTSTADSGTVDIHALTAAAGNDEQQAQTLLKALTLLERDYEEELTASQVLDMSAVREILGDHEEPTQNSEQLPRKKAR